MSRTLVRFLTAVPRGLGVLVLAAAACASARTVPGTTVLDTPLNRALLDTVETYRQRLLARNVEGLLVLAAPEYYEDSGTPRADDDYGYDGLRDVLVGRLSRLKNLRYQIQYRNVRVVGDRAEVEVFIDGSYEVSSVEVGDRYRRISDQHRFVLAHDKDTDKWRFISGM